MIPGKLKTKRGKILRPCYRKGYEYITICGVRNSIHRLVALAFIPNPDGKPEIDHINTIRTDNRVEIYVGLHGKKINKTRFQEKINHLQNVANYAIGLANKV